MRTASRARWATCALAISICLPALAGAKTKSLADCAAFAQAEKGDDGVEFSIHNVCTIPVDCSISWRVVCAPKGKRRVVHSGAAKLALVEGASQSASASAAVCGDDDWSIDAISWSCQPNKD
jgi:hypothetical protein